VGTTAPAEQQQTNSSLPLTVVSREQKLREILGLPPEGTTWLEQIRREVDDAPPLSDDQKTRLGLLLGSQGRHAKDG